MTKQDRSNPDASPAAADRAALILWLVLAALAALRAALAFLPGMWLWGLNLQRFLSPASGWMLWTLASLALIPPLACALQAPFSRLGEIVNTRSTLTSIACAAGAAALVWWTPDRVRFVGDFLLRQGTVEEAEKPGLIYPQALPLDVWLHFSLPSWLARTGVLDANGAGRLLGAIEAALLALLAVAFVRALRLRGIAALAAGSTLFFGGYLGMFTGYSKAFAELCVIVAAVGVLSLRVIREGRGLLALGLVASIGFTLHRSAFGLLPALILVWLLWWVAHGRRGEWKRPAALAGFALPLLTAAVMLPRVIAIARRWDPQHFASPDVHRQGGLLAAAFAGTRLFDLVSLIVMLSPLVLATPLAELALGRFPRKLEAALLAVILLPFLGAMVLVHPGQGMHRDWDDFAATGVALSLWTAWVVGETLRASPRRAWVGVAVVLGVAAPTMQWLLHHTDLDRGLERVEAFVSEPPVRIESDRANTWDYLGIRNFRLERWAPSAAAFRHAVELAPSKRILEECGMAETNTGDLEGARASYRRLLAHFPDDRVGWLGLAAVSSRLSDVAESRRAAQALLRLDPGNADAREILRYLETQHPAGDTTR